MNNPRPEFRIKSLEKRVNTAEASIEELADGIQTIQQDIKKLDDGMMASFKQIGDIIDTLTDKEDLSRLETRLDAIERRLDTMATKDDISELSRILCKQSLASYHLSNNYATGH